VCGVSNLKDARPFKLDERRTTEVHVGWCVKAQARMMVLVVVPAEEALAEGASILDGAKAVGKLRSILERLEVGF
jgi:hypothetical protein